MAGRAVAVEQPVGSRRLTAAALIGPATGVVAVGIFLPILLLFRFSLNQFVPGKFMVAALTPANYVKFATDPFYVAVLLRTLRVALICTAICLTVGFPMGYWLARSQSRHKNLLLLLVVLPLFVGNAVRAAGWMVMFGSKGFVNSVLGGLGLIARPLTLMYTEGAVIVGIVAINLPFVVLTLQSVIEGIDRSVEEAALNLGAGPFTTFRRALLPLAMPGVVAAAILCFILAMNAYATPVLLGGPRFQVMGPLVYRTFVGQGNWPFGAATAFVLMTATLALSVASNVVVQRRYRR
jgi:putative spermidine/putrescine transport system permease protein